MNAVPTFQPHFLFYTFLPNKSKKDLNANHLNLSNK